MSHDLQPHSVCLQLLSGSENQCSHPSIGDDMWLTEPSEDKTSCTQTLGRPRSGGIRAFHPSEGHLQPASTELCAILKFHPTDGILPERPGRSLL